MNSLREKENCSFSSLNFLVKIARILEKEKFDNWYATQEKKFKVKINDEVLLATGEEKTEGVESAEENE